MSAAAVIPGASRCDRCGEVRLPAVERCLACRSTDIVGCNVEGTGRLLAASEVHRPPRNGAPWLAVLAEVSGGLRIVGLGRAPLGAGDDVVMVADEDGVPVFAVRGGGADGRA
ncbi:MAG TPA: zinc ribbon domain-containing protein [Acidimicrobiia bacterium]|nr:zinc ribbon domain-containing protein [Acidimicrobiia bacterium]